MTPKTFSAVLSNMLYERRFGPFFVTSDPYVCSMDLIGCRTEPPDFAVAGTCEEQLFGMCETLWKPNMKPYELFECIAQSLINAFDRDASSGWGAVIHIIEKDKITTKHVETRMD